MAHAFTLACLMAALLAGWAAETAAAVHVTGHDVTLRLEPAAHELRGRDTLTLSGAGTLTFLLHEGLAVTRASAGGRELPCERTRTGGQYSLWEVAGIEGGSPVLVEYGGRIYAPPERGAASRHGLATETSGLIAPEGLFLPRPWAFHPWQPGERAHLRVAVETPAGYEAVSVGRLAARTTQDGRTRAVWEARAGEAAGGFLIGGPLTLHEERAGGVAIYLYLYAQDADLAPAYAARLRELVPLYTGLLGPFPYPKFAVVENFFPTGLGFPSLTLLGRQVVRLPFILEASLAHELVHSWWGGSVEWKDANWVEGLTAYLSDYYLTERRGGDEAAGERRRLLEQFSVYAPRLKEPLTSFQEPGPRLSDALGYTKGALVFHQLRREVGDDAFFAALRLAAARYRGSEASWNELCGCFEEVAGRPLGWFFEQWVERPGAPRLSIGGARVERAGEGWRVSAALSQRSPAGKRWRLKVPVVLEAEGGGRLTQEIALEGERARVEFSSQARPVRLVVDPEAHVLRELGPAEIPARLGLFFAAPERAYILPEGPLREAASEAAQALSLAEPGEIIEARKVRRNGPAAAMFLGSLPEAVAADFPGAPQPAGEGFTFRGQTYPAEAAAMLVSAQGPQRVRVLVYGRSREGLMSAARFLPHLGRYGWAVFVPGERPRKGEPEPARWLSLELPR